jgi:glycosyltransferase involved in cell wall biosynthesis
MSVTPRLTIGLPVYNGANFIAASIEALLGQTFEDFELIISDNASVDGTMDICRIYEKQDSRIRLVRQPHNIGLSPNHNFTLSEARGELFKWASHDDLYARDLLKLCVEALDKHPDAVLSHSGTAIIDGDGNVVETAKYLLKTASPQASVRFRSTLFDVGGDDDGGVTRTAVLRRIPPRGSYHHADRTIISDLALQGPFYHVPQWLFFRRDHPDRAERKHQTVRSRSANMDPRRANQLRNPVGRLYAEYIWGYIGAIRRAPLTSGERLACYTYLASYLVSRTRLRDKDAALWQPDVPADISISALVAGQERKNG